MRRIVHLQLNIVKQTLGGGRTEETAYCWHKYCFLWCQSALYFQRLNIYSMENGILVEVCGFLTNQSKGQMLQEKQKVYIS